MKIRSQILLILLGIVAVFLAGVTWIHDREARRVEELTGQSVMELGASFRRFLDERGRPLALLASPQFRDWDELNTAVENKDKTAVQRLVDDNALRAYGANAVWVLDADSALLYAANTVPAPGLSAPESGMYLHPLLCNVPEGCRYYVSTPQGLMEMRGVALKPSWLAAGEAAKAAPSGCLFAGRLLTPRDARDMGVITGNRVELIPASGQSKAAPEQPGFVTVDCDLAGPDLKTIAILRVTRVIPVVDAFQEAGSRLALWLIGIGGASLVLLSWAMHRLVGAPLHVITRGLHTRDLAPLRPLAGSRSEIGELAGLIADFHAQRDLLVQQMDKRLAAEHALAESEEQLRQAQKMEAIGRLAGGVAHDFNNLLTAIIGYASMLAQKPDADAVTVRQATTILQAGQQAAALTQQLLAFSRKQILQPRVVDANLLVADMERLLRRIIGTHIEIRTELRAMHGFIKADPHQVEQVVLNLAVNARDAMPRGGRITIGTVNETLPEAVAPDLPAGDYVVLQVADTGHGMDKDTIRRIFEPFFTTKVSGKGTGLGLATVYGIVRQSAGAIIVESRPGAGSTFRVFFPRSTEAPQPIAVPVTAAEKSAGGETILVVDDQKLVAGLVGDVLRGDGYRVLVAAGPPEAIGAFREHQVDLLITDIIMPRIDGQTLAEMVRARHENVKILYISGDAESGAGNAPSDGDLLFKPFTPAALSRKVRDVLDGRNLTTDNMDEHG